MVPPALVADIAGGAYPAVMNILLALRRRDATGEGAYLDIAMTDSLFTFEYWAIGSGLAAGQWPGNATDLTTGGTPRYRLYETKDGRIVAVAPIEQRFWELFVAAIGLEPAFADDARDPGGHHGPHRRDHRARAMPPSGRRSSMRPTAAARSCRTCRQRSPTRISARAGCSRMC